MHLQKRPISSRSRVSTNACIYSALSSLSTLTGKTPIFREDNSTLTLGKDGKYYFCFTIEKSDVKRLPDRLVYQALSIAQKVDHTILKSKGRKGLVGKIANN